ncbi:MAG: sodium:solute symporter family protein [Bacteroidia bacterium]
MDVQIWTFIIVGLSFALYIGIAIWSRATSTREFYVAGGGVSPLANGMATAADWMSAASFISMAGLISFMGRDGSMYLMGWTGGYVMLALLLAPYLRKFGKFTVPDFIGDRYYSNTARVVAVFCAIFVSFTYVVGQMKGVGIAFSRFLEVEFTTGVLIGMAIVFFYAVLGGMKGITYTQVAQYCVLIFAYLVPAIFISIMVTGNPIPQFGFGSTTTEAYGGGYLLAKLDAIHTELGFKAYTAGNKSTLDIFCITLALMAGTAGLPHVIIRFFTVPNVKGARKSVGYALIFIAILYTTAPAVAAFARLNMIQTISGRSYESVPAWVKNWEKTKLITIEDKNGDGQMQYLADKNANEVTVDPDIMVLANPEIAKLKPWVAALVAAGGLAAALSTAAGLLLVISTAISHDLLKKTFRPNITDKEELLYARIAAGVAILVSGYFGIHPPDYVAAVVAFAFGLACSSFFPAIFLGIFDKRTNTQGAVSGMIVGIVFTAGYIIYFKFIDTAANIPENWWLGVSPEGIGTIGMIINLVITWCVSRLTPPPPEEVQQMVEDIRIPRGSASPTASH